MFNFFKKKEIDKNGNGVLPNFILNEGGAIEEQNGLTVKQTPVKKEQDFSAFCALAELLNTSVEKIKDECCLYQVRNVMSRLGKVIVRYDISEKQLLKTIKNCLELSVSEILVAPIHLENCLKQVKKNNLQSQKISAFIDFPFGESLVKSKINDLKNCANYGIDGATVMIPSKIVLSENIKELKRQVKKFSKAISKQTGVAINATDIDSNAIVKAIKVIEKTKVSHIVFVFGDTPENEIKEKLSAIKTAKSKTQICVLGNVSSPEGVMALIRLNVDKIFTPFADNIGVELVKRFKIKSVKLS